MAKMKELTEIYANQPQPTDCLALRKFHSPMICILFTSPPSHHQGYNQNISSRRQGYDALASFITILSEHHFTNLDFFNNLLAK
jgi:hypothetical protein